MQQIKVQLLVYTLYQSNARTEYGTYKNLSAQPFLQSNHHTENSNILLFAIFFSVFCCSNGSTLAPQSIYPSGK